MYTAQHKTVPRLREFFLAIDHHFCLTCLKNSGNLGTVICWALYVGPKSQEREHDCCNCPNNDFKGVLLPGLVLRICTWQWMNQQGVSQLVCKLCLLISRTHVNIMEYPFNHLITLVGDFVWGMKYHRRMQWCLRELQKLFLMFFFHCGDFLPTFEDIQPILGTHNMFQWKKK